MDGNYRILAVQSDSSVAPGQQAHLEGNDRPFRLLDSPERKPQILTAYIECIPDPAEVLWRLLTVATTISRQFWLMLDQRSSFCREVGAPCDFSTLVFQICRLAQFDSLIGESSQLYTRVAFGGRDLLGRKHGPVGVSMLLSLSLPDTTSEVTIDWRLEDHACLGVYALDDMKIYRTSGGSLRAAPPNPVVGGGQKKHLGPSIYPMVKIAILKEQKRGKRVVHPFSLPVHAENIITYAYVDTTPVTLLKTCP